MKMTNQSRLHYLFLFAGINCLQILAPKCSAAKTQGMLDSVKGDRGKINLLFRRESDYLIIFVTSIL